MLSVARVKFIKTKVIFRYYTKGVSNPSFIIFELRNQKLFMFKFPKMGKNEKVGKNFLNYKTGQ